MSVLNCKIGNPRPEVEDAANQGLYADHLATITAQPPEFSNIPGYNGNTFDGPGI